MLPLPLTDQFAVPTLASLGIATPALPPTTPSVYLCGNSLGLMPKSLRTSVLRELDAWSARGVESHFNHPDGNDWVDVDLPAVPLLAPLVGALELEVALMGSLTANLNALLATFYKPTAGRHKIMFEKHAFPSDYYAFLNMVQMFGYDESALVQVAPRAGEHTLRTEDIVEAIRKEGPALAVVCFPGIQYYTGQFLDIETITRAGQEAGAVVGWDLAHAVGNVELRLHDWNVDFAAWCSYKYLNSGPGAIGGIYLHERHCGRTNGGYRPRMAGWWGNNAGDRFKMEEHFDPIPLALGFRQLNPSVLDVAACIASLRVFALAGGMPVLREQGVLLTARLETALKASQWYGDKFEIITPSESSQRGQQLSLLFKDGLMEPVFNYMRERGVVCDERRPNVIRIAPAPLYNLALDVDRAVEVFALALESV